MAGRPSQKSIPPVPTNPRTKASSAPVTSQRPQSKDIVSTRYPAPKPFVPTWQQLHLTETHVPGEYRNAAGILVDEMGVALGFATRQQNEQRRHEQLIGGPVDTPAKLLKAAALDPTLPLLVRVKIAADAAPYWDRKMPISVADVSTPHALSRESLKNLNDKELETLAAIMAKLGLDLLV